MWGEGTFYLYTCTKDIEDKHKKELEEIKAEMRATMAAMQPRAAAAQEAPKEEAPPMVTSMESIPIETMVQQAVQRAIKRSSFSPPEGLQSPPKPARQRAAERDALDTKLERLQKSLEDLISNSFEESKVAMAHPAASLEKSHKKELEEE